MDMRVLRGETKKQKLWGRGEGGGLRTPDGTSTRDSRWVPVGHRGPGGSRWVTGVPVTRVTVELGSERRSASGRTTRSRCERKGTSLDQWLCEWEVVLSPGVDLIYIGCPYCGTTRVPSADESPSAG